MGISGAMSITFSLSLSIFHVILESISCRTRANRLINKGKTTEWLKKNCTGLFIQNMLSHTSNIIFLSRSQTRTAQSLVQWPVQKYSAIQSYCPHILVGLLSYDSRLTIIQLDVWKIWTGNERTVYVCVTSSIPVQIFLSPPVILLSFNSRFALVR